MQNVVVATTVDRAEPYAKRPRDPSGEPASSTPARKKARALAPPRAPPKMPPPHPREASRAKWRIPKKRTLTAEELREIVFDDEIVDLVSEEGLSLLKSILIR